MYDTVAHDVNKKLVYGELIVCINKEGVQSKG